MRPARSSRFRVRLVLAAVALGSAAWAAGCTIPITAQTLTGGALNAGAMLFVDQYNDGSEAGEGSYGYYARVGIDTLAAIFEAAVEEANRTHMFAPANPDPRAVVGAEPPAVTSEDGVVLARSRRRAWRPDDPPAPETFPERQWTPAPLFAIGAGSPEARGDTLMWVITHRAARQVAFLLVARGDDVTRVALVPYEPPGDIFLSVPSDHAQRNAVEELHQTFYFAAAEHLGPGVLAYGGRAEPRR